jgi:hypothetical protein
VQEPGDGPPGIGGAEPDDRELEQDRRRLLDGVVRAAFDTTEQKVAWILNNYPAARDSDITLQLRFWEAFVDDYDPRSLSPDDLYRLPRLTTLTRARARIQNKLKLFQATPEVRSRRGTLSREERERAVRDAAHPVFAIFADESGKTQDNIVVGSLWVLRSEETLRLVKELRAWRTERGFFDELHFANVGEGNLGRYMEAVDIVTANASALGFKSASIPRRGAGQIRDAVSDLFYHLIVRGLEHETDTGRAPLPRILQMWKDEEEESYDKLLLADIRDRLAARFGDQLPIDMLVAVPSRGADLVQVADLFTGSVNRLMNGPSTPPASPNAKDRLAEYLLRAVGWTAEVGQGDMAVSVSV